MNKILLFVPLLFFFLLLDLNAQIAISEDGSQPSSTSMLELKSADKGFLRTRLTSFEIMAIIAPAEGLSAYNKDSKLMVYYNGSKWLNYDGTEMLSIGDYLGGGIVFHIDDLGGAYVCAIEDQATSAEWGCYGTEINGADGSAIGTGKQNTIDIETDCSDPWSAAGICSEAYLQGFKDWFLPSKDELNAMYQNKESINTTAITNGGNAFESANYWSSTEWDGITAELQHFGSGNRSSDLKYTYARVRAIRYIDLLSIGDYYNGGIIIHYDGAGSGLICAIEDQATDVEWGCYGTEIDGADGSAIGTGNQNTIDIEAGCGESGTAANICANLTLNDETDWFLPSRDELHTMYLNKERINATALNHGGSAFTEENYWNSTEWDGITAEMQHFGSGNQSSDLKYTYYRVRAVRPFEILSIGDYYQGGIIFHLDGEGGGLICAIEDQGSSVEWGCYGTEIAGADGNSIGTGNQNTIDIEAGCGQSGTAANICANLSLNGYTDWFLPSRDELHAMFSNKESINTRAIIQGGSAFSEANYWNSTEVDGIVAEMQHFGSGNQSSDLKYTYYRVRAIREF